LIHFTLLNLLLLLFCEAFAAAQTPSQLPGQTGAAAPLPPLGGQSGTSTANPQTGPQTGSSQGAPPPGLGVISGLPTGGTGNLEYIEMRAFTNVTQVTGDARDRSFLTPGNDGDVDLSYLQDLTRGDNHFEFVTVGRYTNDPRVDPEQTSLQRAYIRITNPHYELNIGDYLVNYSRFTYNQNVRGLNYIRNWSNFRLLANAGAFTDYYGSFWKIGLPGKPFTRLVAGVRAERKLGRDKQLAVTWAFGNDLAHSVPLDATTGLLPFVPVRNQVVSLDSRMTFFKLWNLQAEAAYSLTNPDASQYSDPTVQTQACPCGPDRKDYAVRFDNTVRFGSWIFSETFARIMPSFYAVNARQIADLQDGMFRVSDQISKQVSVQASYEHTNNDLRNQDSTPETTFQLPQARVSFRDLPGLGPLLLDFGYRERHDEQNGLQSNVTRAPFTEVGIPISSNVLTVGFEHRSYVDHISPWNTTSANDVYFSFRSIFNLGDWTFSPLIRWELNREALTQIFSANNNRTSQAGLVIDAPKWFIFEGLYRQIGATLFQEQAVTNPLTQLPQFLPNGQPVFAVIGPSGFRRPTVHAAITYKIRNSENRTVAISYDQNGNYFALPGQNFFERVMQLTVVWRFRRQ